MKLLFQSDDYGITEAVSAGILKGIREGIIRNTGLFVNMPSSAWAAEQIKAIQGIDVGIDINFVAGRPVSDIRDVPNMVDEEGRFVKSGARMKMGKIQSGEGRNIIYEVDPYVYEEVLLETENQVKRFIELMGRKPAYLHGHSFGTPLTQKAARVISEQYDIPLSMKGLPAGKVHMLGQSWVTRPFALEDQVKADSEEGLYNALKSVLDKEIVYYICHCGFVDEDIFQESTYTIIRNKDLVSAVSPKIKALIEEHKIELITHSDLKDLI